MIPLVSTEAEIKIMKDLVIRVAGQVEKENKLKVDYLVELLLNYLEQLLKQKI